MYKHIQHIKARKAVNIGYKRINARNTRKRAKKTVPKKDRKFHKLQLRYQFLLYYKRTKKTNNNSINY